MIPATEKEASKIVLKKLKRLAQEDYDSDEWKQEIRNVFVILMELRNNNTFDEHADALHDILVIHYPESIDPILDVVISTHACKLSSISRQVFKEVLHSIERGRGLNDWEVEECIIEMCRSY